MVNLGDIYLCDFGAPIGHEPGFRRPAVVVSRRELSRHGVPIVVPVTRTRKSYPTHVELSDVLPVVSYVQCELIRAVSTDRLIRPLASLDNAYLAKIETILRRILDL